MSNAALEVVTFIGGCIFYAFRGWVGKQLLSLLFWLGKKTFRVTATEMELYTLHKNETLAAKQSNKVHAQK